VVKCSEVSYCLHWLHFSTRISQFSHLGHGGSTFLRKVRTFHHFTAEIQNKTILWSTAAVKTWKFLLPHLLEDGNTASKTSRLVAFRMSVQQQQQLRLPLFLSSPYVPPIVLIPIPVQNSFKIQNNRLGSDVFCTSASLSPSDPLVCTGGELTRCGGMSSSHLACPSPTYVFTNPK
jgi:hypothetical protein